MTKPIPSLYKIHITRYRLVSHKLKIEQGRYTQENRRNRICSHCNLNDIEDEFHFILVCPYFNTLRKQFIKKYYYNNPSVFKLIQLLSVNNLKELCNLGKYLY